MKIISGKYKGRNLFVADGKTTRPTTNFIKEAIFSIIFDLEGKTVLDLYAGSGSLGIEAYSRGAYSVDLVEFSSKAISELIKNVEMLGCKNDVVIKKRKVDSFIKKCDKKYDLIFIDPPYQKNLINKTIDLILKHNLINKTGIIIVEHHPQETIKPLDNYKIRTKKYSNCNITIITGENNENL